MTESLEIGIRLALEPTRPHTGVVDRVEALLNRPLIAVNKNTLPVLSESFLSLVFEKDNVPMSFQEKLQRWRIVAFAKGLDKLGEPRIAFLYYDEDDNLKITEIQRGIPLDVDLTREGIDDDAVVDMCFERGFIPFYPAGAYPQSEEL